MEGTTKHSAANLVYFKVVTHPDTAGGGGGGGGAQVLSVKTPSRITVFGTHHHPLYT